MRRVVVWLVIVGALAPAASARAECEPKQDAELLRENRQAIVVETRAGNADDGLRTTVWGCLRRTGRWQRIARTESSTYSVDDIRQVRLKGSKLAYAWERGDPRQDIAMGVHVYDLVARRRTTGVNAGYAPRIPRVVLAKSGTVAYSVLEHDFEGDPPQPRRHRRIYTARGMHATVIDDSLAVRLKTLKLRGSSLTWRHGDATRRLTLP